MNFGSSNDIQQSHYVNSYVTTNEFYRYNTYRVPYRGRGRDPPPLHTQYPQNILFTITITNRKFKR